MKKAKEQKLKELSRARDNDNRDKDRDKDRFKKEGSLHINIYFHMIIPCIL